MAAGEKVAVPAQHWVRTHQQPHSRSTTMGSRCSSAARNARSLGANRTRSLPSWRSSTTIWWRKASISTVFSRSLIGNIRSVTNAFVTPR